MDFGIAPPASVSRRIMATVGRKLGANKAIKRHMGKRSYQEIKKIEPSFNALIEKVIAEVNDSYTHLSYTEGDWGAVKTIIQKLRNDKAHTTFAMKADKEKAGLAQRKVGGSAISMIKSTKPSSSLPDLSDSEKEKAADGKTQKTNRKLLKPLCPPDHSAWASDDNKADSKKKRRKNSKTAKLKKSKSKMSEVNANTEKKLDSGAEDEDSNDDGIFLPLLIEGVHVFARGRKLRMRTVDQCRGRRGRRTNMIVQVPNPGLLHIKSRLTKRKTK